MNTRQRTKRAICENSLLVNQPPGKVRIALIQSEIINKLNIVLVPTSCENIGNNQQCVLLITRSRLNLRRKNIQHK